ncbi:alkaline phosphatase family protein [Desulfonema magnum]|uniref:2,3-bisphosphoglycerate-independent phosphoglycerate mutase n=1 Tax=Desulfonema magnum TaxID=45655 RepID=A0A975BTK9_9BACT|nr:alkaline phosphatase family protein [Desulfonema magnum]QTA90999.1 2,3-bisphosphoglycerate-independent phosphoglycerate mutase [Desulfonema magnum]
MSKKCVLILLDGLGDRSYKTLADQTPLQAAITPVLDNLAEAGANGLYHAAAVGQALPSENAHFIMFGYDMEEFPGRGALEALGAGIKLNPEHVAVLIHFASLRERDGYFVLEDGKLRASENETRELIHAVGEYEKDGVSIRFIPTEGLRGIAMLQGHVAPFVTDTDPIQKGRALMAIKPWADHLHDMSSQNTAEALKAYLLWAYHHLKNHPVNISRTKQGLKAINGLVTQRAGQLKKVVPFSEKYGLRGLSVSSGMVFQGLCKYVGLDHKKVADTGNPGNDIAERLRIAREALDHYDFIHVHTKTPDEAAHTKVPGDKKSVIESLDRGIGEAIAPLMNDPDVLIFVTSDHSTPSAGQLIHSGETVPLIIYGEGVRHDQVREFDEISAACGALGGVRGKELMYLMLNHLDRCKLHGLMDTPADQPFWPGNYEPFRVN